MPTSSQLDLTLPVWPSTQKWVLSISQTKLGNWQIYITLNIIYCIIIENKYVYFSSNLLPMPIVDC